MGQACIGPEGVGTASSGILDCILPLEGGRPPFRPHIKPVTSRYHVGPNVQDQICFFPIHRLFYKWTKLIGGFTVVASGAFSNVCACRTVSQFPRRTPFDATPFTRVIPLASSGASSPLSAASTASFRTAVIRTLMETVPRPRA